MEPLLQHITPFMLVLARLLGLFLFAPVLGSQVLPRQAKAVIALSMTAAIYPFAGAALTGGGIPDADIYTLAMMAFGEVLIGAGIGMLASLPLIAFELGGMLMGYQMGLSVARAFNPEQDTQTDVIGQLMFYLALGAFLTLGGLDALFGALVLTFEAAPVGAFWLTGLPAEAVVTLFGAAFEIALRVAAPGLVISTMVLVGMALVMKTMPQINILSVGFAVKIMVGLSVIILSVKAVDVVAGDVVADTIEQMQAWAVSPALARGAGGGAVRKWQSGKVAEWQSGKAAKRSCVRSRRAPVTDLLCYAGPSAMLSLCHFATLPLCHFEGPLCHFQDRPHG